MDMNEENHPQGLGDAEARALQRKYGRNELRKEDGKALRLLLSNMLNPLSAVLIAVSAVLYLLRDPTSGTIIVALVLLNGLLGFYQEYKSERASEKLRTQISVLCKVRRDGAWKAIPAAELVPGDVVRIEAGDLVPADLRLHYANNLSLDQSSLTGESYPVRKTAQKEGAAGAAYMGSMVSEGIGAGVVTATGGRTSFGKTATLLGAAAGESAFEKSINDMSGGLLRIIILSALAIFIVNALTGKDIIQSFLFAVALAVGLVPEAMPIIITITLSNGALALSRHGVIAKRLSAIEDLGNVDIICTDKTGTLTENRISIESALGPGGKPDPSVIGYAACCVSGIGHFNPYRANHGKEGIATNPIDQAIIRHVKAGDKGALKEASSARILSSLEFSYELRRMSVLAECGGKRLIIAKGSPEPIFDVCDLPGRERQRMMGMYRAMGEKGLRAIAVAVKEAPSSMKALKREDVSGMRLAGLITFVDPPKKSVKDILGVARKLHVDVKLITGDNPNIAKYIARSVGFEFDDRQVMGGTELARLKAGAEGKLGKEELLAMSGPELHKALAADADEIGTELLRARLEDTVIFARMSPSQKHFIIKKLREYGHSVAFLGDGVNDAPAIKEADVDISVNNGSDVTKEAADIILLNKSLNAVIQGISGGRKVFSNVVKYIINTLSGNFGDLYTIGLASAFIPFIPLTPVQILLSNFLSDAPMVSISTDNVEDEELLKPKKWDISGLVRVSAIFGLISTVFDLMVILYFVGMGQEIFRTALFIEVILSEIAVILVLRSTKPIMQAERLSIPLLAGIAGATVIGLGIVYSPFASLFGLTPLPPYQLAVLVAIIMGYVAATEIVKTTYYGMFRREIVSQSDLRVLKKRISPDLR